MGSCREMLDWPSPSSPGACPSEGTPEHERKGTTTMFVSLRLGSFLRLLTAIAVGAVIIGFMLAQPPAREQEPADVMPPEVVQTTGSSSMVLPAPQR